MKTTHELLTEHLENDPNFTKSEQWSDDEVIEFADFVAKERAVEFGKYTVMCLRSGADPRKSIEFPFTSAVKTDEEHLIDWYDTFINQP